MSNVAYQPPAHSNEVKVSFPQDHVMLLTFNRPKALNAVTPNMTDDVKKIMDWFDNEPGLWWVVWRFVQERTFELNTPHM